MAKSGYEAPIACVHTSRYPNEPVEIIGNRKGLERLINVLIEAVDQSRAEGFIQSSDGHEAPVSATCLEGVRRPEEWRRAGSPLWDIDDPFIARIVELTEENERLRGLIALLRRDRKRLSQVDDPAEPGAAGDRIAQG